jgi:hypothetical protein
LAFGVGDAGQLFLDLARLLGVLAVAGHQLAHPAVFGRFGGDLGVLRFLVGLVEACLLGPGLGLGLGGFAGSGLGSGLGSGFFRLGLRFGFRLGLGLRLWPGLGLDDFLHRLGRLLLGLGALMAMSGCLRGGGGLGLVFGLGGGGGGRAGRGAGGRRGERRGGRRRAHQLDLDGSGRRFCQRTP